MNQYGYLVKCLLGSALSLLVIFGALLVTADQAEAIPAFARKYKTSCTTCHTAVPKRNAFGEAFRRNGYSMPEGDEMLIKQEPISLGAEAWKEAFPDAIWPGKLPAEFPISAYVHQRIVLDSKRDIVDFDMPHELEIFMGGTFDEKFSFFGEFVLFEKGKNAPGLKRFYLQINDLIGPLNAFNIRVGRIEPGITEGLVDNQRVMLEHATTLDIKPVGFVSDDDSSMIATTSTTAQKWRPRNQQSGIEFNGILNHRFQYAVGVVNGEKKTINDASDEKDVYGRVAVKFGGMGLDGYQPEGLSELKQTENWADNAVTVGVYAYHGNNASAKAGIDNDFNRFGFDFHGNYNRFDVYAGAILGTDDNPGGFSSGAAAKVRELNSLVWFIEGYYMAYPWLQPGLRIGSVKTDQNDVDIDKYMIISPNLTILARANVRLTLEALLESNDIRKGVTVEKETVDDEMVKWIKANVMFVF